MFHENYLVYLENPFVRSFVVLISSIIAAKIIDILLLPIVLKITHKTQTKLDEQIIGILRKPIFLSVILIGILVATATLELTRQTDFYIKNGTKTLLLIIWGFAFARIVDVILDNYGKKMGRGMLKASEQMIPFLERLIRVVVIVVAGFLLLNMWGANITPLLASAGLVGIAIAFAAKDTIANIFGGVSVFIDRPYKIGDYIIVDEHRGEVIDMGLRSTKIRTRDNILISIPNSIMASTKIINETGFDPILRVKIAFGVAYGTDLKKLEKVVMDIAKKNEYALKDPEPRVRFREFGDSALKYELLCWIKEPELRGIAMHSLNSEIHNRFAKEKIVIAFPQRDVHLKK